MVNLVRRLYRALPSETSKPAVWLGVAVVALGALPAAAYGLLMLANTKIDFNASGLGLFAAVFSIGSVIGFIVRFKKERREAWFSDSVGLLAGSTFFVMERSSMAALWLGFILAGLMSDYFASQTPSRRTSQRHT